MEVFFCPDLVFCPDLFFCPDLISCPTSWKKCKESHKRGEAFDKVGPEEVG